MAAIVTDQFRVLNAKNFVDSVKDPNNSYYILLHYYYTLLRFITLTCSFLAPFLSMHPGDRGGQTKRFAPFTQPKGKPGGINSCNP